MFPANHSLPLDPVPPVFFRTNLSALLSPSPLCPPFTHGQVNLPSSLRGQGVPPSGLRLIHLSELLILILPTTLKALLSPLFCIFNFFFLKGSNYLLINMPSCSHSRPFQGYHLSSHQTLLHIPTHYNLPSPLSTTTDAVLVKIANYLLITISNRYFSVLLFSEPLFVPCSP